MAEPVGRWGYQEQPEWGREPWHLACCKSNLGVLAVRQRLVVEVEGKAVAVERVVLDKSVAVEMAEMVEVPQVSVSVGFVAVEEDIRMLVVVVAVEVVLLDILEDNQPADRSWADRSLEGDRLVVVEDRPDN